MKEFLKVRTESVLRIKDDIVGYEAVKYLQITSIKKLVLFNRGEKFTCFTL